MAELLISLQLYEIFYYLLPDKLFVFLLFLRFRRVLFKYFFLCVVY